MKLSKQITKPRNAVVIICVVVNLVIILAVILLHSSLPPEVPLFYGLPMGEEQLANSRLLILPSIIALLLTVINSLLLKLSRDQFLQNTILSTMIVITTLSSITVIKIISLIS